MCEAIFEASLPRQAGDLLPRTPAGLLAAVAERLDSLVGLWAAGCAPSAAADPYGLRRAALGMLQARLGLLFVWVGMLTLVCAWEPAPHVRPTLTSS